MCYEDVLTEVSDGWAEAQRGGRRDHNITSSAKVIKERTVGGGVWVNPGIFNSYTKHSAWRSARRVGSGGGRVSGKGVSHLGTHPACLGKESGLYGTGRQWIPPKVFPEGNSLEADW